MNEVKELPKRAFRLDDQIGHLLRRAYHAASGHFAQRLKPYRLKPQQFATLARLTEMGPTAQTELGARLGMARANIHVMVERLKARGLIVTRSDPDDSRRRIVALSKDGKALVERLVPLDLASTEDALAPLDDREREILYRLLRKIEANAP